ncbi:MAG: siderophore biosynthesis protein-like protein [Hyphomicrobiales bacterium]|nr:siderophore biosynthesis protein-like protein [Hyphomicrobiales bacterium]
MIERPIRVAKHSLVIAGHCTSISLEEPFWVELKRLATERNLSLAALVAEIDSSRGTANLSSAIRIAILEDLQSRAERALAPQ